MVETLWDAITRRATDFIEGGQERRQWLDDLGRRAEYYVPPELRNILGFVAEATPTAAIDRAAQAGGEMLAPGRTLMQRLGSAGQMLSETAGVVAPAMVANRAAMPAAQAIQESLLGASMAADDVGRRFVERMNQPGPVPTMYSNPVGRADKPMTVFHGGPTKITSPRATVDPEGLPRGFSVTSNKGIAQNYADMRGGGVVSEFSVDPSKYNPISEFDLYQLQDDLEVKLGFDEGDLPEDVLLSELRSRGINAIEYPDPEFGTRIIDPSILSPTLPAPRNEAEAMAKQVLEMRAAGRAGDVTDEMMAAADPQYMFANTPLPMGEASRMARAREMGFGGDLYHGSAADFPAFDQANRGRTTSAMSAKRATWMTDEPDVAGGYATFAEGGPVQDLINRSYMAEADGDFDLAEELMRQAEELELSGTSAQGGNIQPLRARGNRLLFDADGEKYDANEYVMMDKVNEAQRGGYAGLQINNFVDNADYSDWTEATHVGIFDPRNIRSRFARFDPEFSHLRNLSAGVGGLGILSVLAQQEQEVQ